MQGLLNTCNICNKTAQHPMLGKRRLCRRAGLPPTSISRHNSKKAIRLCRQAVHTITTVKVLLARIVATVCHQMPRFVMYAECSRQQRQGRTGPVGFAKHEDAGAQGTRPCITCLYYLKMLSGKYADTIQLGASTISLIFKSTAAPHKQYACSRVILCSEAR